MFNDIDTVSSITGFYMNKWQIQTTTLLKYNRNKSTMEVMVNIPQLRYII